MPSDWAIKERKQIPTNVLNNTGIAGESAAFQEDCISFVDDLMQSYLLLDDAAIEVTANQLVGSGQSLEDAWYWFSNLIFSAAMSTTSDSSHRRLVDFIFALANSDLEKNKYSSEVASTLKDPRGFAWIARDLWNGRQDSFKHKAENPR